MDTVNVHLVRYYMNRSGTLGVVLAEGQEWRSMEPPWKDNQRNLSCIPCGEYTAVPHVSLRFGKTYLVQDTPGRSWILTHSGNLGGDVEQGLKTHTQGCILLGETTGILEGQLAVLLSKPAIRRFLEFMAGRQMRLLISAIGTAKG